MSQTDLWEGHFAARFNHRRAAKMAFAAAGVTTRHAAVNPLVEDISSWSTTARMERYVVEAMPLGKAALTAALDRSGLGADEIGMFVVTSCTGYATPGIDVRLARDLAMAPAIERVQIGHMGCHAAFPALSVANSFVVAHHKPALVLCLELSSLHVQPPTLDVDQYVVHALFSDAAGAFVIEPADRATRPGLEVLDTIVRTDAGSLGAMTWLVTDFGFRMTLARTVAETVGHSVGLLIEELLERNKLSHEMIDAWAVHPGGPRILDAVGEAVGLTDADLAASRRVLAEHGNCSSATILLVIEELRGDLGTEEGRHLIAVGFGPGLTLCAALLRTTSQ